MLPTTILTAITIISAIIITLLIYALRESSIKKHLKAHHVISVFTFHDGHIKLNDNAFLSIKEFPEQPNPHTISFLVMLIVDGEKIDTAQIDYVSFPFLTNHHELLKFKGPWHQLVVKQYIPMSKQYIEHMKALEKELKASVHMDAESKERHTEELFKQSS